MNVGGNSDTMTFTIKKSYLYVGVGLLVGFGAGLGVMRALQRDVPVTASASSATGNVTGRTSIVEVATEGRPYRGPDDAPVTLVEFSDYECPFCGQHFRQTYPNLLSEYEGKLRYVVRNFPIRDIHPQAQKAAEAAECAYEQGKFWDYHDLLFTRAPVLDVQSLKAYAAETGLDAGTFNTCLDSGRTAEVVAKDLEEGIGYGVRATPTFFINGRTVVGAAPLAQFKSYVDAALEEAQAQSANGQ